jgi:hypothetical protein
MGSPLRAVGVDIVGSLVTIAIAVGGVRMEEETISPRAVGVGLCWGMAYTYVREHEPLASIVDNFWRQLAVSGLEQLLYRVVGRRRSSGELFSGALGVGIGMLLYRLVYGVIYDVPPARLRRQWSLPFGD